MRLIGGTLPEREALRYARERPSGLGLAVTLATRPGAGSDEAARAWQVVAAGRGVVLDELAARQHDVVNAGTPAVRERLEAFVRARTRLANLVVRGPEDTPLERFKTMLAEARERRAATEQALADVSQPFRAERARNRAGLSQMLSTLSPGQALVAYVRYDRVGDAADRASSAPAAARPRAPVTEYAAFVATAGTAPRLVRLGTAARVERSIGGWRAQIDAEIARRRHRCAPARSRLSSGRRGVAPADLGSDRAVAATGHGRLRRCPTERSISSISQRCRSERRAI